MSFGKAIETFFKRYFDFQGRSSRSEYWWFSLFNFLIQIATILVDLIIFGLESYGLFNTLWGLAIFIGSISLYIRRLHDINKSGWWTLSPLLPVPLIILIITLGFNIDNLNFLFVGLFIILYLAIFGFLITLFVFSLLPGTKGANRFGENPLDNS